MQCPKCGQKNPDSAQFCTRCHSALRYKCPACNHVQDHGGKCDKCGVDFTKYGAMLLQQIQIAAEKNRERRQRSGSLVKQLLLLPITGGFSLVKYLLAKARGE